MLRCTHAYLPFGRESIADSGAEHPMPPSDPQPDALARIRHDLKGPLTVIKGRAQLASRDIGRFAGLTDAERERLFRHLSTISHAADELVDQIDDLGRDGGVFVARSVQDAD